MAGKKKTIKSKDELTDNEVRFCDAYLVDFNGTKAAIAAGYSKKTAAQQASRLLTKVKIQAYLQSKKAKIANKLEITQERTMQEIARLAFSDIRKIFNGSGGTIDPKYLDDDTASTVASVEVFEEFEGRGDEREQIGVTKKVKLWDKTKALEMLAKHFKIYSDAPVNNNTISVGYGKEE